MKTLPTPDRCKLSGTALKLIACTTMLIDHIGASCIETQCALSAYSSVGLARFDLVLRLIGRLAFPIFCFLLTEGFAHTHDVKKYAGRMLLFALVSEVPFDWAFFGRPFYWGHQNVYWTLLWGILAMSCLARYQSRKAGAGPKNSVAAAACGLGAAGCAMAAEYMNTDYGAIGVLLIILLWLLRESRRKQCIAGGVLFSFELTAPLAFVLIWRYSGQRGRCPKWAQWAFYLFYPVHLAVLGMVTNWVIR